MGCGRLNKMVQGKDTLNKNQILTCRSWWHGPLFFLHQFLRLVLLFLLYHRVAKLPSLIIICSFFYRFCTSSSSSRWSAKVSCIYLEISALSSGGIDMSIAVYHSWRELIYHLFRTDLLRSIFDLFLSVIFEILSSWCCNNVAMIVSLSVAGEHHLRYRTVTLTS